MITLFTGTPGAGKTAEMVRLLEELAKDRPLFGAGLDGLKLPHTVIDPKLWHELVPDGAVVFVDEAQHYWRPRGPSVPVPAGVAALETHRHRGVDFFLTTQRPGLLDANVRALVGRHVHLRDTGWLGRWMYEWPEISDNLAWRSCTQKRRYKLPARVFDLYKSASLHVKPVRGRSPWWWFGIGGAVALGALAFVFYRSFSSRSAPAAAPLERAPVVARTGDRGALRQAHAAPGEVASFVPRVADQLETAPAYDHLRQVVRMPRLMGGFCSRDLGCRCYIDGGLIAPISADACAGWVSRPRFDPYYLPVAPERQVRGSGASEGPAPTLERAAALIGDSAGL